MLGDVGTIAIQVFSMQKYTIVWYIVLTISWTEGHLVQLVIKSAAPNTI
jgi:hypothetical protein